MYIIFAFSLGWCCQKHCNVLLENGDKITLKWGLKFYFSKWLQHLRTPLPPPFSPEIPFHYLCYQQLGCGRFNTQVFLCVWMRKFCSWTWTKRFFRGRQNLFTPYHRYATGAAAPAFMVFAKVVCVDVVVVSVRLHSISPHIELFFSLFPSSPLQRLLMWHHYQIFTEDVENTFPVKRKKKWIWLFFCTKWKESPCQKPNHFLRNYIQSSEKVVNISLLRYKNL